MTMHAELLTVLSPGALAAVLVLSSGCGAAGIRSAEVPSESPSVFELLQVGENALEARSENQLSCSLRPYWGRIVLEEARWSTADSLFINCPRTGGAGEIHARQGNGRYEHAAGDTLKFYVDDSTLGVNGYVFTAVLHGDELRLLGAAEDAGDFIYRRRRARTVRPLSI